MTWHQWHQTAPMSRRMRSEEHTSELQSHSELVCRLLLEKKNGWLLWSTMDTHYPVVARLLKPGTVDGPRECLGWHHPGRVKSSIPVFFFNDTSTTEIYTLSLHDALPI